jgi:hypothetical protein
MIGLVFAACAAQLLLSLVSGQRRQHDATPFTHARQWSTPSQRNASRHAASN